MPVSETCPTMDFVTALGVMGQHPLVKHACSQVLTSMLARISTDYEWVYISSGQVYQPNEFRSCEVL